jgi:hypothetical protein
VLPTWFFVVVEWELRIAIGLEGDEVGCAL